MARLSTYVNDVTVLGSDRIIGTDSSNVSTKNFTIESLQDFILEDLFPGIPGDRVLFTGTGGTAKQGGIRQIATTVNSVTLPSSVTFTLLRDGEGFVIEFRGYDSAAGFPYDVESFLNKTWTSTDYLIASDQTITTFLDPPFRIDETTGETIWRFRVVMFRPLEIDSTAGTVGRAITNVTIQSLDLIETRIDGNVAIRGTVNITGPTTAGVTSLADSTTLGVDRTTGDVTATVNAMRNTNTASGAIQPTGFWYGSEAEYQALATGPIGISATIQYDTRDG